MPPTRTQVSEPFAYLHALLAPSLVALVGVAISMALMHHSLIDSIYWSVSWRRAVCPPRSATCGAIICMRVCKEYAHACPPPRPQLPRLRHEEQRTGVSALKPGTHTLALGLARRHAQMITMTTVGYGDISPSNAFEKVVAMAFMPLAASSLGATINRFEKLSVSAKIYHTNFRLKLGEYLHDRALEQARTHYTYMHVHVHTHIHVQMRMYVRMLCGGRLTAHSHAEHMPSTCRAHAEHTPSKCQPHANLLPTTCQPHAAHTEARARTPLLHAPSAHNHARADSMHTQATSEPFPVACTRLNLKRNHACTRRPSANRALPRSSSYSGRSSTSIWLTRGRYECRTA